MEDLLFGTNLARLGGRKFLRTVLNLGAFPSSGDASTTSSASSGSSPPLSAGSTGLLASPSSCSCLLVSRKLLLPSSMRTLSEPRWCSLKLLFLPLRTTGSAAGTLLGAGSLGGSATWGDGGSVRCSLRYFGSRWVRFTFSSLFPSSFFYALSVLVKENTD